MDEVLAAFIINYSLELLQLTESLVKLIRYIDNIYSAVCFSEKLRRKWSLLRSLQPELEIASDVCMSKHPDCLLYILKLA